MLLQSGRNTQVASEQPQKDHDAGAGDSRTRAYIGDQLGDVAALGHQHARDGAIKIDSEKTEKRMDLPMLAALKATIKAGRTSDLAIIFTRRGTPLNHGAVRRLLGRPELLASAANRPMACARRQRARPKTGRPGGSYRPFLAGPGDGWRSIASRAPTAAGLQRGPLAS